MKAKLKIAFETLHGIADRKKYPNVFRELMPVFLNICEKDLKSMSDEDIAKEMKEMYKAYKTVMESMRMRSDRFPSL